MNHTSKVTTEIVTIPLSRGKGRKRKGAYSAIVSPQDADLFDISWTALVPKASKTAYAIRSTPFEGECLMHRVILARKLERPLESHEYVDHVDRDGLNNTRENLRLADAFQNNANVGLRSNNKSGVTGVRYRPDKNIYVAQITYRKRKIHLGHFDTLEEAVSARLEAAEKLHGDFANNDFGGLSAAAKGVAPQKTARLRQTNKSGFRGVCFDKRKRLYEAYIGYKGIRLKLGKRKTAEEAYQLRLAAEERIANGLHPKTGQSLITGR